MSRTGIVAAAALLLTLAVLPMNSDALRVTYRGDAGTLSLQEQQDVLDFLLVFHAPELAVQIMDQALTVEPRAGDTGSRVTIREAQPGEALFCLAGSVKGPIVTGALITTVRGDGLFSGGPLHQVQLGWGTIMMFHGAPSTNKKMVLGLDLAYHVQ